MFIYICTLFLEINKHFYLSHIVYTHSVKRNCLLSETSNNVKQLYIRTKNYSAVVQGGPERFTYKFRTNIHLT